MSVGESRGQLGQYQESPARVSGLKKRPHGGFRSIEHDSPRDNCLSRTSGHSANGPAALLPRAGEYYSAYVAIIFADESPRFPPTRSPRFHTIPLRACVTSIGVNGARISRDPARKRSRSHETIGRSGVKITRVSLLSHDARGDGREGFGVGRAKVKCSGTGILLA